MKKLALLFCICFLMIGCGKYNIKEAEKDLEEKINNLNSYKLTGEMEIVSNDDIYKYNVDVAFSKSDKFRVSLKNKTNNHEQIILKNKEGVYVLTPTLNKSFKFQSDWPYNNSQVYLLQTLLSDIQNDSKKQFKETTNNYIFITDVNYPNNSDLVKQKIYFDKKLNPKKVEVLNSDNDTLIKMTFKTVKLNQKIKSNYFTLNNNMQTSKTTSQTKTVSKIEEEIYPMYIPENTKLTGKETINLDKGQRVIMTFEGENPFMLVEQTASISDETSVMPVYGEPYQIGASVAAVSDNMVTWINNGIEYYVVANNMTESELINVASSVSVLPVGK